MMLAASGVKEWAAVIAPAVVLFVGLVTLLINGERAERQRRRELQARGLTAAVEYAEMPFAIRRRRCEPEHRSEERVRLTTRFSEIQAELAACSALIDAEGNAEIASAYQDLVGLTRSVAGDAAREAWKTDAIERDEQVNMPDLAEQLQPLRAERAKFAEAMKRANRSTWTKFMDAIRAEDN